MISVVGCFLFGFWCSGLWRVFAANCAWFEFVVYDCVFL